ncbi:MAG: OB-fold nucleic acid binding domain-containing protein [Caldilineales bacterium]|nr:OB-fold nucleic acid binding domain-containing protein [Caldilineales bacterium]MDW8318842.1 OB-fold nucleic acid binding domain-containing protein [Anaerolineae bacterium]
MKRVYAADIRPGDRISDYFRLVEARLDRFKDAQKGHFLRLVLADRSGQIEARLWEGAEAAARQLQVDRPVRVRGRAVLDGDRLRLRLDQIEPAETGEVSLADLFPAPTVDLDSLLDVVLPAADHIADPNLRRLAMAFYGDGELVEAIALAPAAQPGSLLAEVADLLTIATGLAALSPRLDLDLLRAAILLYGVGLAGLGIEPSRAALSLLGPAALSDQAIAERLAQMPDFPAELALRLRHAVRAAWEPACAQTPEAATLAALRQVRATLERVGALQPAASRKP